MLLLVDGAAAAALGAAALSVSASSIVDGTAMERGVSAAAAAGGPAGSWPLRNTSGELVLAYGQPAPFALPGCSAAAAAASGCGAVAADAEDGDLSAYIKVGGRGVDVRVPGCVCQGEGVGSAWAGARTDLIEGGGGMQGGLPRRGPCTDRPHGRHC